ncbi:MAG: hypothetical protein AAF393_10065 [Pseudomonadota bacterium]
MNTLPNTGEFRYAEKNDEAAIADMVGNYGLTEEAKRFLGEEREK